MCGKAAPFRYGSLINWEAPPPISRVLNTCVYKRNCFPCEQNIYFLKYFHKTELTSSMLKYAKS